MSNPLNMFAMAMTNCAPTTTDAAAAPSPAISRASSGTGLGAEDQDTSFGVFTTSNNSGSQSPQAHPVVELACSAVAARVLEEPLPPSPQQLPFPSVQHTGAKQFTSNTGRVAAPLATPMATPAPFPMRPATVNPMMPAAAAPAPPMQYVSVTLPSQSAGHHLLVRPQPQQQQLVQVVPAVVVPTVHQQAPPPTYQTTMMPLPSKDAAKGTDYGAQWRKKHGSKKVRA